MLGHGAVGNSEPVGLPHRESSSVGRECVGDRPVRRVVDHERAMLPPVQSDERNHPVAGDHHFMELKTHIGEGAVQPLNGGLKRFRPTPASFQGLVSAAVIEIIGSYISGDRLGVAAGSEVQMVASKTLGHLAIFMG